MAPFDADLPFSPAAERNKQPIVEVLMEVLEPGPATLLEISSGTGQHAVHFAQALPGYRIQPSDRDPTLIAVIEERRRRGAPDNLLPPVVIDVRDDPWPVDAPDAIFNANMVHIAPWTAAEGLMRGAGQLLADAGLLVTYGPYKIDGAHTSASNASFDLSLRQRDPDWGVRDLEALQTLAESNGLLLERRVAMPANNFTVVWRKRG